MRESAPAKINLALHVRGREPDGYHRIETLFAFAGDGDELRVAEGEGLSLSVEGPFAEGLPAGEDNLVLRAARALAERFGVREGAALVLDKRLPVASGIGGGSADAGAALRLLRRFWGIEADDRAVARIAAGLGADVPACLLSRTCRGTARGDRLETVTLPGLAGTPVLLVNPGVPVSTAEVFRRWDGVDRGALGEDFRTGRNDLEAPALAVAPAIGSVLEALRGCPGVTLPRMSGSGATCFALFADEDARDAARAGIAAAHPEWWLLASRLR